MESGGQGSVTIRLKTDNGHIDNFKFDDAVYMPTSPFNLPPPPPQILIDKWKREGIYVRHFQHDNLEYIFDYKSSSNPNKLQTITAKASRSKLFTIHTGEGYSNFCHMVTHYNESYSIFAGASHIIPDEEEPFDKPREPHPTSDKETLDKPRESQTKTRESMHQPYI